MSAIINLNGTDPAASAGKVLGVWQKDPTPGGIDPTTGYPYYNVSVEVIAIPGIVTLAIDGGGSPPATGAKGTVQCPYAGTLTGWTLLADVSGSAQITVSKGTYSAFPTVASIVASAPPILSTAQKATSTTLTGWTTAVAAGDIFSFNLDSVTTCTRIILELQIARS
jgi:hypothetical protein